MNQPPQPGQPQQPPIGPYQQPAGPPPYMNQYQQWQTQAQFTKSYTTPAVIVLVLYVFLWVPGLIANIVYLVEANKTKQITGQNPDGYGCLWALMIVVCGGPLAAAAIMIFLSIVSASFAGFH